MDRMGPLILALPWPRTVLVGKAVRPWLPPQSFLGKATMLPPWPNLMASPGSFLNWQLLGKKNFTCVNKQRTILQQKIHRPEILLALLF
jgi:hypothetical protein